MTQGAASGAGCALAADRRTAMLHDGRLISLSGTIMNLAGGRRDRPPALVGAGNGL